MPASRAQRATAAEKRSKAVALRLAGADWQTIANQVGYASPGAACNAVRLALQASLQKQAEVAQELRELTVQRYDRLQAAYWPKALKGDVKAAEIVLKCLTGRARIEGTEAPTRVNVEAEQLGAEIAALIDQATQAGRDQPGT